MDEKKTEILKMYFGALREEALERVKLVSRIELGKFVVVTTVLGFAIGKGVPEADTGPMTAVFGLLPLLAVLFDFYIAFNHAMIHTLGQYMRDHIEKGFALNGVTLWEEYVSGSNQRKWDALGRSVHFSMTLIVMVISGFFFYPAITQWGGNVKWWMAVYIIWYSIFAILDFCFLRIYKKLKGEYYA